MIYPPVVHSWGRWAPPDLRPGARHGVRASPGAHNTLYHVGHARRLTGEEVARLVLGTSESEWDAREREIAAARAAQEV